MTLSDQIEAEAGALAFDYPKGASPTDIAGYFGAPISQVESALSDLRRRGVDLAFMVPQKKESARLQGEAYATAQQASLNAKLKNADAVQLGQKGGAASAAAMSAEERTERARAAANARWGGDAVEAGRKGGVTASLNRLNRESRETASPTTDDVIQKIRASQEDMARAFPFGGNAEELAEFLGVPRHRMYAAIKTAEVEGWCEQVKSYGNKQSGRIAVFAGMHCPAPMLTDLQRRVLDWIKDHAKPDGTCEVKLNKCAADLEMGMVTDKLDSMERKGYIARLTPYQYNGNLRGSPIYQLLPPPETREPELFLIKPKEANQMVAFAADVDARGYDVVGAEPYAVRRARERRFAIEAELKEIDAFLATYERLSK